jgi:hypothetical protein
MTTAARSPDFCQRAMQAENNGVSDERREAEREPMLKFFVGATNDWCAGDWR